MNRVLERGKRFCGYIVGIVFFVSGMFKLLDPVGAGLVMSEYYDFFHIGFMDFSAKAVAYFMALVETLLGAALITGLWRKVIAIITMSFLGFFTLLTLILLIFNPVMDCGCFGEVLHLTHWQTFLKNIVLCALAAASFFPFSALGKPKKRKYVSFGIVSAAVIAFSICSLVYIPLKDYTEFKPGVMLNAAENRISGGYDEETYQAEFIYEKNGREKSFTLDDLPDSTWTFVRTETVKSDSPLASSAYDMIVSLPVMDDTGVSRDELLAGGPVLVVSVYKSKQVSERKWTKIAEMLHNASDKGYRSFLLVASTPDNFYGQMDEIGDRDVAAFLTESAYFSDYKAVVSMNRSNGGLTYFNSGYLIRKWAYRNYPDKDEIPLPTASDATEITLAYSSSGNIAFQAILLFAFAVLLIV